MVCIPALLTVDYEPYRLREFPFTHFSQKFRVSNGFTKYVRKFIILRENFSFFHTTQWKFRNFTATVFPQKFRQIDGLLKKELYNKIDLTEKNCAAVNFLLFHTVHNVLWKLQKFMYSHIFFAT